MVIYNFVNTDVTLEDDITKFLIISGSEVTEIELILYDAMKK
jgi:hypothetical protein